MLEVKVDISRYIDASFPGWVECRLVDAFGDEHVFVEKVPMVTKAHLDAESAYPQCGAIACAGLAIGESDDGRRLVHIDTQTPWGVQSLEGRNRFDVFPEQLGGITIWKDVELYERGLQNFAFLTPLERDYFVIKDVDLYYEMEGGFEDYILSGTNTSQLMWLKDALQRIGDAASANILKELECMNESQRPVMALLCESYSSLHNQRWQLLRRYLENNGIVIDESP